MAFNTEKENRTLLERGKLRRPEEREEGNAYRRGCPVAEEMWPTCLGRSPHGQSH